MFIISFVNIVVMGAVALLILWKARNSEDTADQTLRARN
jgi:hypothetical protein